MVWPEPVVILPLTSHCSLLCPVKWNKCFGVFSLALKLLFPAKMNVDSQLGAPSHSHHFKDIITFLKKRGSNVEWLRKTEIWSPYLHPQHSQQGFQKISWFPLHPYTHRIEAAIEAALSRYFCGFSPRGLPPKC